MRHADLEGGLTQRLRVAFDLEAGSLEPLVDHSFDMGVVTHPTSAGVRFLARAVPFEFVAGRNRPEAGVVHAQWR